MTTHRLRPPRLRACAVPCLAVVLAFGSSSPSAAQGAPPAAETEEAGPFAEAVRELRVAAREGRLPGAALIVFDGGEKLEHFEGRYHGASRTPVAGVSTWLAAATVLTLAEDGTLDLDDPLLKFLPEVGEDKGAVTLRQLLAHTSGLPSFHPCLGDPDRTLASCAEGILAEPLAAEPGQEVRFSEAGYQVAGHVAELAGGGRWEDLFQQRLAQPLGLTHTTFGEGTNPRIASGARTTAADLSAFFQGLTKEAGNGGVLSAALLRAMVSPQGGSSPVVLSPYGEGWRPGLGPWIAPGGDLAEARGALGSSLWLSGGGRPGVQESGRRGGLLLVTAKPATARTLRDRLMPFLESYRGTADGGP